MKLPEVGDIVWLRADGGIHTVTCVIKSDLFPSGHGVECDGSGYQGVFSRARRRTGLHDLSQIDPVPSCLGPPTRSVE
jgi:hypothetical protein